MVSGSAQTPQFRGVLSCKTVGLVSKSHYYFQLMMNCLVIGLAIVAGHTAVVAQNQHITGIPATVIASSCPSQEQLDTTIKSISQFLTLYNKCLKFHSMD